MSCPPDRYWCSFNLFWIIKKILEKIRGISMAEKLDPKELVSFKELLMANSIQVDAVAQLLIEKGIITTEEFFAKLKQVQSEYQVVK
jgi:beta-N-acetylglucosaminidase